MTAVARDRGRVAARRDASGARAGSEPAAAAPPTPLLSKAFDPSSIGAPAGTELVKDEATELAAGTPEADGGGAVAKEEATGSKASASAPSGRRLQPTRRPRGEARAAGSPPPTRRRTRSMSAGEEGGAETDSGDGGARGKAGGGVAAGKSQAKAGGARSRVGGSGDAAGIRNGSGEEGEAASTKATPMAPARAPAKARKGGKPSSSSPSSSPSASASPAKTKKPKPLSPPSAYTVKHLPALLRRAKKIGDILDSLYPDPKSFLRYRSPFELLVCVALSAQTTDVSVNAVTPALFALAPDARALAALTPEEVFAVIRTLGLARTKSRNLVSMARLLVERHGGEVPRSFEALEALPGVGHKTASVVRIQAFDLPAFPVDTHIHRLAERWGLSTGKTVEVTEADLKLCFPDETTWARRHVQIIAFGREHCPARGHDPRTCPICSWVKKEQEEQEEVEETSGEDDEE